MRSALHNISDLYFYIFDLVVDGLKTLDIVYLVQINSITILGINSPDLRYAHTVSRGFVSSWITRFGIRSTIITDQGRHFESKLWEKLMQLH